MAPVVLITGVSSGIGLATATYLASRGMEVFGTVMEPVDGLLRHPDGFRVTTMDVSDDVGVREAVGRVLSAAIRIDVLVNNAGISHMAPLEEFDLAEARRVLEVNTLGPLRVIQAVLPLMREQGRGLIINTTSIAGQIAIPFDGVYTASKFALEGLSEALSLELRPFGVGVVMIEPGDINTGMSSRSAQGNVIDARSPYATYLKQAQRVAIENERSGSPPTLIARKIEQIINSRCPALRYVGGSWIERLMIPIKHLLPSRLFEALVAMRYFDRRSEGLR